MKSNKPSIVRSNEIYQRAKNIIPAGVLADSVFKELNSTSEG